MLEQLFLLAMLLFFSECQATKDSKSSSDEEWATILVATASPTASVNVSDLFFNRLDKFDTSDQVFTDTQNVSLVLQGRQAYRSCFIDAWGRARYCSKDANNCAEQELLDVHMIRFTLWDSADVRGASIYFYPITNVPRDWFKETNVKDMELMICEQCRFTFNIKKIVIAEEDTASTRGVLQIDWRENSTEFLYIPYEQPMVFPLNSREDEVIAASHLSMEVLLDESQASDSSLCPKIKSSATTSPKSVPVTVFEKTEVPREMTTEATMSDTTIRSRSTASGPTSQGYTTQDGLGQTSTVTSRPTASSTAAMTTTSSNSSSNNNNSNSNSNNSSNSSYFVRTTCVSVMPDGSTETKMFTVNVAMDESYTNEVEAIYSDLVIPKPILSRYKRRLRCASDERTSSRLLGALACISISTTVAIVVLLDLTSWRRHLPLLKRNLCHD